MKRLTTNLLLIFCLLVPVAHADIIGYSIRGFLSSFQINTTTKPKIYISWTTPLFGTKYCQSIDLSRWNEIPSEKMNLYDYIYGKVIPLFGSPSLTPEEEAANCYGGNIISPYHVKPNGTLLDRPTYDPDLFAKDGSWVQNGRVLINSICDTKILRKTQGYEYHLVTNKEGKSGLTACIQ